MLAVGLAIGQAYSGLLCPACNGGRSREGSMRLSREPTGLRWRCYRNKCRQSGFVPDAGELPAPARKQRKRRPRAYYGVISALPVADIKFYGRQFGLSFNQLTVGGVGLDKTRSRHVWPIHDPYMRVRGHNLRAASPDWQEPPIPVQEPKWDTYLNQREARCSWCRMSAGKHSLLLVEDQISALKASACIDSCALLGTSLYVDVAAEIARQGYRDIMLALDQDATSTAYKIVRQYGGMLPIRPVLLAQDVKDMPQDQIEELLT